MYQTWIMSLSEWYTSLLLCICADRSLLDVPGAKVNVIVECAAKLRDCNLQGKSSYMRFQLDADEQSQEFDICRPPSW